MKKIVVLILTLCMVFCFTACGSKVDVTIAGSTLTVDELKDAFKNNQVNAKKTYEGQDIVFSDTIKSINADTNYDGHFMSSYIETDAGFIVETSSCDVSGYSVGDTITVSGNLYNVFAGKLYIYEINGHSVSVS